MSQKKVLITGITGQDGSYMAEYCVNLGHKVYGMVRRTSTLNLSNVKHLVGNENFKIVYGDLNDGVSIDNLVKAIQPDYFINFAAQSFVGCSWEIPEETFMAGAVGVLKCLEAVRKNAPQCRFYNAGSSEQFGDVAYVPQDEKHPFRPRSPYGAAKCAAHHLVKVYRESYGIYAIQGLLFNHESERRGEEFVTRKITKGVGRIVKALSEGKPFAPIELGNLDAKRDWSHSLDFVDGVWKMLNQEQYLQERVCDKGCDVNLVFDNFIPKEYVLSSGQTHTIREFVEKAFGYAGIRGAWLAYDLDGKYSGPEHVKYVSENKVLVCVNPKFYRPAEVDLLLGSSELIQKELGWKPTISFDNLVRRMVECDLPKNENRAQTK